MIIRNYTFSECISQANIDLERAFYYGSHNSKLRDNVCAIKATNAGMWFELATIAKNHSSIQVRITHSGMPFQV